MKKFAVTSLILPIVIVVTIPILLYSQSNSRPTIFCASLEDTIRPRDYCLMNPFRERNPEKLAETILQELKNGNPEALDPYLTEHERNHFLKNEKKFRIENWRIGRREDSENKIWLMYWVSRQNYDVDGDGSPHLEEVSFHFTREGNDLKLKNFSAIY